jgi:hypothetical protein
MNLTHLVFFGFFPGAGDSAAPAVSLVYAGGRRRGSVHRMVVQMSTLLLLALLLACSRAATEPIQETPRQTPQCPPGGVWVSERGECEYPDPPMPPAPKAH